MSQCKQCHHSVKIRGELRCLVREMRRCRYDGKVQRLEMVPGLCSVLNPHDDCPVFMPKLWIWLWGLLKKLRHVTKD